MPPMHSRHRSIAVSEGHQPINSFVEATHHFHREGSCGARNLDDNQKYEDGAANVLKCRRNGVKSDSDK